MSAQAQFASAVRAAVGVLSAANTARDGTGTLVTVLTAGANGSRIDDITIVATGAVTAGVVRLFLHDGTNARLLREVMVTATTPSTSVETFTVRLTNLGICIPTGWSLRASTHNAEGFNVIVNRAGDF